MENGVNMTPPHHIPKPISPNLHAWLCRRYLLVCNDSLRSLQRFLWHRLTRLSFMFGILQMTYTAETPERILSFFLTHGTSKDVFSRKHEPLIRHFSHFPEKPPLLVQFLTGLRNIFDQKPLYNVELSIINKQKLRQNGDTFSCVRNINTRFGSHYQRTQCDCPMCKVRRRVTIASIVGNRSSYKWCLKNISATRLNYEGFGSHSLHSAFQTQTG